MLSLVGQVQMTFSREHMGYFIAFMLIGGILGSALGNLLVKLIPSIAIITSTLTGPIGFSLEIVTFSVKLNIAAIAGIIGGIVLFRKL